MSELTQEIRINDRYTHLYDSQYDGTLAEESSPSINRKTLLTSDYLKRIKNRFSTSGSMVLPPNCRFMTRGENGYLVVIEEPPAIRSIAINMSFNDELTRLKKRGKLEEYGYKDPIDWSLHNRLTLAFPYVIFILSVNQYNEVDAGRVYFRVARLQGLGDYLLKAPLLNISDTQDICFGDSRRTANSVNGAIDKIINIFWSSEFNPDYMYNYEDYRNVAGVNSYLEWQALTKIDPMFIYNVNWIKMKNNINDEIEAFTIKYGKGSSDHLHYQNLLAFLKSPLASGITKKPTARNKRDYELYFDVASGMFLSKNYFIHVGDPFYIKHGKVLCYINSFLSFQHMSEISYIRVETEDGKLIIFKLTGAMQKYILNETKKLRFEESGVLKNGVVIKENDIVCLKTKIGDVAFKKVYFIRKTQEGLHEARLGDAFYILENTEATIFNVEEPIMNGIKLQKDVPYALVTNRSQTNIQKMYTVLFEEIDVDKRGNIAIKFNHIDKGRMDSFTIPLANSSAQDIYKIEDLKELPNLFRSGRALMFHNPKFKFNKVYAAPNCILYEGIYEYIKKPTINSINTYILKEDTFYVQSHDMDICFQIGDKVVTSDWENPINMLSVKQIKGFKTDAGMGDVFFILSDKKGNLTQHKYIHEDTIYVGTVRKIINNFDGVKAGTKIQATETGIAHFPKKDTNIIIGFLTDTGGPEPLVLCSNCCTLWYSDVCNKFKQIPTTSPDWKKIQHAKIDIAKIKYQAGDIIQGVGDYKSASGWLVTKRVTGNGLVRLNEAGVSRPFIIDKYLTECTRLDYIPTPRISQKNQELMNITTGFPNLHGYFLTGSNGVHCLDDERSQLDV